MDKGDTLTPRLRRVKVNASNWTWQRMRMLAAWMELHVQDVAGYLITREMDRLWKNYAEDPEACQALWEELIAEMGQSFQAMFEEGP